MLKQTRAQVTTSKTANATHRRALVLDDVVAEALRLLADEGLDALSTRRLAARLDVKSPALYWHLRNKNELLGLVADALCAEMALPVRSLSFRNRLDAIAREYRRVLTTHRDAARLFAEQAPTGPHRMKLYDAAVGAFLDRGFHPEQALAMATFFRNFLLGLLVEEARQTDALAPTAALDAELSALGDAAAMYPSLHRAAGGFAHLETEALFRLGLTILLDGIERQAPAGTPKRKSR